MLSPSSPTPLDPRVRLAEWQAIALVLAWTAVGDLQPAPERKGGARTTAGTVQVPRAGRGGRRTVRPPRSC